LLPEYPCRLAITAKGDEPMSPQPVEDDGSFEEQTDECFLLSLESHARDWNRPEEDAVWAYLQPGYEEGENEVNSSP
jgi:hypothetical protein